MKINLKNKKTIGIIAVSAVVALILFIVIISVSKRKKTTPVDDLPAPGPSTVPVPGINSNGTININEVSAVFFPLKFGSKNDYVRVLQTYLKSRDATLLATYGIDGHFGAETEAACVKMLGVSSVSLDMFKQLLT
jgi:hypothetical protein